MIKVNINQKWSESTSLRTYHHLQGFLPKMYNLNLIIRKFGQTQMRVVQDGVKSADIMKDKERPRSHFILKESKDMKILHQKIINEKNIIEKW